MVNRITPNYYAIGELDSGFELEGVNFNQIPDTALGFLALTNDDPTQYKGAESATLIYDITEKTDNRIVLTARDARETSNNVYLGVLASPNGETIYWVNNTQPLP